VTAEFRSTLDCRILDDDNGLLLADFIYYSDLLAREIRVPAGFITDFASVPRFPGAYWLVGGRAKWEATIHDYLYRVLMLGREVADNVFLEAMATKRKKLIKGEEREWKQPAWVRAAMWSGVRAFGWWSYRGEEPLPEPDPFEPMKGE
jgi:hypothetical protein